jgi:DNA-binding transcriptional ArsR family regulator
MVEYMNQLNLVFGSLSDPTRRDILKRVAAQDLSVGEIAEKYSISLAAVAKHIKVLEGAKLIKKTRKGKEQIVAIVPGVLDDAQAFLHGYKDLWEGRLNSLDNYLQSLNK